MSQTLWIGYSLPTLNEIIDAAKATGHGIVYSAMKKKHTDDILLLAKAARLLPVQGPIGLDMVWHEKDARRDPDNVRSGAKFILDGLVKAGIIEGDGPRIVQFLRDSFRYRCEKAGVLVTISEASPVSAA